MKYSSAKYLRTTLEEFITDWCECIACDVQEDIESFVEEFINIMKLSDAEFFRNYEVIEKPENEKLPSEPMCRVIQFKKILKIQKKGG